jgi:hypothetical protein
MGETKMKLRSIICRTSTSVLTKAIINKIWNDISTVHKQAHAYPDVTMSQRSVNVLLYNIQKQKNEQ